MIGALFLAIPRTSLGISVYEREVVRYNHITATYLRFLEDTFPYIQKYGYEPGMELILAELASKLKDNTIGSASDRALLLDFRAANEKKPEKAIKLELAKQHMETYAQAGVQLGRQLLETKI